MAHQDSLAASLPFFDEGQAGIVALAAQAEDEEKGAVARPTPQNVELQLGAVRDGISAGFWEPDQDTGLPPECPVLPMGVNGNNFYFMDTLGQIVCVARNEFSQNTINALFMGRHDFLAWMRPQYNQARECVGWKANKIREDLMAACWKKGAWSPDEKTQGRGAWLDRSSQLLVHSGTRLWTPKGPIAIGEVDGIVYPMRPPLTEPWPVPIKNSRGPAQIIHPLLQTWNWERPELDPVLFLGWLGCAVMGGCLPWRPVIYITGDAGQGKSTLQTLAKMVLNDWLVQATNATAASVYQRFKVDALPVAIDEMEGEEDNRRGAAMIKMAREAASGGNIARGGDKGEPTEYKARSCFMFSSINTPPLENADKTRIAMLHLKRLHEGAKQPFLDRERLGRCGRAIMRRMIDNWPRFQVTWQKYADMLAEAGHQGRGQKVFGTLMAAADMIIDQDGEALQLPLGQGSDADLKYWTRHFMVSEMHEFEGIKENWRAALDHMITSSVDAWRGDHRNGRTIQTVAELLGEYKRGHSEFDFDSTKKLLCKTGLNLIKPKGEGQTEDRLFIPNDHQQTQRLFQNSKWYGRAGAGVWSGAFRQAPETARQAENVRIEGWKGRGISFGLADVMQWTRRAAIEEPKPDMEKF